MQGNPPVMMSKELADAIDACSKSLLRDAVFVMASRNRGAGATEKEILEEIIGHVNHVSGVRNKKPPNLMLAYDRALSNRSSNPDLLRM